MKPMKTILLLLLNAALVTGTVHAGFRTWTSNDGKKAVLEVYDKSGKGKDLEASFRMRNGKTVKLTAADLCEADVKYLEDWSPNGASVFDEYLKDDLLKLNGNSLKSYRLDKSPTKYFLFYYTASWCGPCQNFTPSLVKFYDEYKPSSDEFEIILITSDADVRAMAGYAKSKGMNWPHLSLSKVKGFKKEFNHPGSGIPNLVLTDLEGKLIKTSYEGNQYLGPTFVMEHLKGLLSK
jgi:thiol-disulfide isomerase/thioredoxin